MDMLALKLRDLMKRLSNKSYNGILIFYIFTKDSILPATINLKNMKQFILLFFLTSSMSVFSQSNLESQVPKEKKYDASIVDEKFGIQLYESLNLALGGDSVRMENGYAVNNWKEDYYKDGSLMHRGYYIEGQLKVYKNYYPNGQVEREFKNIDGFRSLCKLFYTDGALKSEVKYVEGSPLVWVDYYKNGQMEYYEEYHKSFLYYIAKRSYFETGQAQSLMELINKKKLDYSQNDFYNNGNNKIVGSLRYDMSAYDYFKTGKWTYYNESGKATKEELYDGGLVIKTKNL